ncbi:hypothetical protein BH23CHL2_BH23CHL2_03380 [soil metagenome]
MEHNRASQSDSPIPANGPMISKIHSLELAGAVSALLMVAFGFLTRGWFGTLILPEIIANTVLRFMPIGLFSAGLGLFGGWAKPILLGSVILGIASIGSAIARFDAQALDDLSIRSRVRRTLGLIVAVWVPLAIFGVFLSPLGIVFFATNRDLLALELALLAGVAVYGLSLYWFFPLATGRIRLFVDDVDAPARSQGRRRLLGQATAGAVGLVGLAYLGRLVLGIKAGATGDREGEISLPVTPTPEFYTVSKNIIDPSVSPGGWSLAIRGMVENEFDITYDELLQYPSVEQHATLTCISNPIGGDLIDNAIWVGVRLSDVLEQAGVHGEPGRVAFHGEDGYSDSFEFSKAIEPTTIIAYLMNGEALTDKHGFPARLIVPGKYGIKNGKWLRMIELVDDFRGYWQHRGWTNEGNIKTISLFERPLDRAVLSQEPQEIGGLAFAGPRGISKVEYSLDDGVTWIEAETLDNPGPLSWTIWRTLWTPAGSGAYELQVRATDGTGELQSPEQADPEPDGASGYHRVVVGIA